MIDAHTHLNIEADEPMQEYIDYLNDPALEASVLILNSPDESKIFWDNVRIIQNSHNVHVAFLMDINNPKDFEKNVVLAKEYGLSYSIKLYPRLTNITEKEFDSIPKYIEECDYKNIIVDSFLYGSNKDNNCYIELSVYLAKLFPEKNIVMAHFGGIKVLETMLRTRELKNIYYDCSFSTNYLYGTSAWIDLRHCILHNSKRVVFGSDRPSFSMKESEMKVRELLGDQPEELYAGIFTKNARRLYFE